MMFLFASTPARRYSGLSRDVNQYVSMHYFWANDENQTEIAALMTEAGLPNVVYVDAIRNTHPG